MTDLSQESEKAFGLTPTCSELLPSAVDGRICSDWYRVSRLEQQIYSVELEMVMK